MSEQENRWENFYQKTNINPAHELVGRVLDLFPISTTPLRAVDLGCGAGSDTLEMLGRGCDVLAIDAESTAIKYLRAKCTGYESQLQTRVASFAALELFSADLVYASYSLPFCAPRDFPGLWGKITAAIKPGGRFAGQFFGVHDTWADDPEMNFHTEAGIRKLFQGFKIEYWLEEDKDGEAVSGPKHWHVFHVIAVQPND
jgi:tellurite methyltransferase